MFEYSLAPWWVRRHHFQSQDDQKGNARTNHHWSANEKILMLIRKQIDLPKSKNPQLSMKRNYFLEWRDLIIDHPFFSCFLSCHFCFFDFRLVELINRCSFIDFTDGKNPERSTLFSTQGNFFLFQAFSHISPSIVNGPILRVFLACLLLRTSFGGSFLPDYSTS